ncbi:uncharacterized protein LOC100275979 [Zea mays]|uniref:Uncharacterized protein n=1 Tax=Zea mays TaxID=4577 RepID=B6T2A2_MAIZE|nr:uncharacterized protein LOC100275979 [Zea mays]ACG31235.1 hypothetical protein [Zea mays]ACR37711.1 unknown [Zea mays]|eukprot:NP_001143356.1 uncharacterized protein LOC100275979 [Zea mays]
MPAGSEAVGEPGGCGHVEEEYEIRNDEGFVYKVHRGLYPDAAPSTTQTAAGPDPKAAGLRRRRRALLRLRAKRLRDLSRWEALASELLAPLPAPPPPAPTSQSPPVAASSSSLVSVLDELLAQADIQVELMKKVCQWCDEANSICDAGEAAIVDSIVALPMWGANSSELVAALCSPDKNTPGKLDEPNGCQEASGVSSAAAEMIKNSVEKQTMGHDLPPILTESRTRKRVANLSGTKRKKASGTPRSITRRKAASSPARVPDIFGSPGPLTRRRAAAQNVPTGNS